MILLRRIAQEMYGRKSWQTTMMRGYSGIGFMPASLGVIARRSAIMIPSVGFGVYLSTLEDAKTVAFYSAVLPVRLARDAYCAGSMVLDYTWSLRSKHGQEYEFEKERCHERGAQKLLDLCFANGGIYIKLGQHIAMLDHMLPDVYVSTMRRYMLDKCPVSSWESVKATVEEEMGGTLDSWFQEFDEKPIASASLAQVHRAVDKKSGETVAVKVQHRHLREISVVDLAAIDGLVKMVKYFAPNADFTWLVNEAKDNLPRELDFRVETQNAEYCAEMVESSQSLRQKVAVPKIRYSSPRVLVMEFIHGVNISDKEGLKRIGCSPKNLAHLIALTFNEMIFRHGNVHADPHPANLLIRQHPDRKNTWQLVLLDHGLYRHLDDDFRLEYSKLWKSLIFADVKGIEESAQAMNAGHAVPLFAGMLTQRQWKEVTKWKEGSARLGKKRTDSDKKEIQEYVSNNAQEIAMLLQKLPRQILLLLKTNDNLRALDVQLNAGYNSFIVTARECTRAISEAQRREHPGWKTVFSTVWARLQLEGRLFVMQSVAAVMPVVSYIAF